MTPNWKEAGFKDKTQATIHILDCIQQNPGCADQYGKVGITLGKHFILITPKKRKEKEYAN